MNEQASVAEYAEWRKTVEEITSHPDRDEIRLCAVIDPNINHNIFDDIFNINDSSSFYPLLLNTYYKDTAMLGPWFLDIGSEHGFIEYFFANCQNMPIGILYQLKGNDTSILYEHVQNLLECRLPDQKQGIFRFYDPRVLHALCLCESKELNEILLGPAMALYGWEPGFSQPINVCGHGRSLNEDGFYIEQEWLDVVAQRTTPYAVLYNMSGSNGDKLRQDRLNSSIPFVYEICQSLFELGVNDIRGHIIGVSLSMSVGCNIFGDKNIESYIIKNIHNLCFEEIISHEYIVNYIKKQYKVDILR